MKRWVMASTGLWLAVAVSGHAFAADPASAPAQEAALCDLDISGGAQAVVDACTEDMTIWPASDRAFQGFALLNRANAYASLGEKDKALADLDRSIALRQDLAMAYLLRADLRGEGGDAKGQKSDAEKALLLEPDSAAARGLLISAMTALKDFDGAAVEAEKMIASPEYARHGFAALGYAEVMRKRYPEAIAVYDRGLRQFPDDPEMLRGRAGAREQMEDLPGALADLTRLIAVKPTDDEALFRRSVVHMNMYRPDLALVDLDAVTRLTPGFAGAYNNRALIYLRRGEVDRALAETDLLTARVSEIEGLTTRAMVLIETGKKAEARIPLDAIIARQPSWRAYSMRAATWTSRDNDRKLADLDAAFTLNPPYTAFLYGQRALIYAGMKKNDLALADAARALADDPEQIDALHARARAYDNMEDTPKLLAALDRMMALAEPSAGLSNWRCWTLATTGGDLAKALGDCNEAVKLSPKSAGYLDSRGMVHLQAGRYDLAIADYDAALAISPKLDASLYGRGLARLRKGETEAGRADLAAATAIDPDVAAQFVKYGLKP